MAGIILSHTLLILKIYTTFKDVQMMLKHFLISLLVSDIKKWKRVLRPSIETSMARLFLRMSDCLTSTRLTNFEVRISNSLNNSKNGTIIQITVIGIQVFKIRSRKKSCLLLSDWFSNNNQKSRNLNFTFQSLSSQGMWTGASPKKILRFR